jgi:hypothetical protein
VESETAAAKMMVAEAEAAVERENISVLKRAAAGTTEMTFEEMLEAIGESVDAVSTSDEADDDEDDEQDGDDNNDAKLSDDDQPEWVVGTIDKSIEERLNTFWTM